VVVVVALEPQAAVVEVVAVLEDKMLQAELLHNQEVAVVDLEMLVDLPQQVHQEMVILVQEAAVLAVRDLIL
jgi:hypothetical protein